MKSIKMYVVEKYHAVKQYMSSFIYYKRSRAQRKWDALKKICII